MNHQTDENWEDDPDLRQVASECGGEAPLLSYFHTISR